MQKPYLLILVLSLLTAGCAEKHSEARRDKALDTSWHKDILDGYEARYVDQGISFDGPCRSTIIRKKCDSLSRRAYLYVHGFNDYFFQKEMGERFVDSGYNFYAVDLRRYGRSLEPWQYPFNVRDRKEYFADLDSAFSQIVRDGNTEITLSGHSTGGLTVLLYGTEGKLARRVDRIVTDSPFLEWNYSPVMRAVVVPVAFFGRFLPDVKIRQSHCDGYAYSLLKRFRGEWNYDTSWKMIYSPPVTLSWVRYVENAQESLMRNSERIGVPVLVMHSSRKVEGCNWTPAFMKGDAVLDPAMLQRRGEALKCRREVVTISDGLHDLILSPRPVRDAAYDSIFSFMRRTGK